MSTRRGFLGFAATGVAILAAEEFLPSVFGQAPQAAPAQPPVSTSTSPVAMVTYEVPAGSATPVASGPTAVATTVPAAQEEPAKKGGIRAKAAAAGKSAISGAKKGAQTLGNTVKEVIPGEKYAEIVPAIMADNTRYYIKAIPVDSQGDTIFNISAARQAELRVVLMTEAEFVNDYNERKKFWKPKPAPKKGNPPADYEVFPVRSFENVKPLSADTIAGLLDMIHAINSQKLPFQNSVNSKAINVGTLTQATLEKLGACDGNACADLNNLQKVTISGLGRKLVTCVDYPKQTMFSDRAASGFSAVDLIADFRNPKMLRVSTRPLTNGCPIPAAVPAPAPNK